MTATLHHGDCREVMASMPEASVDAIVCDPPYGLEFMGKGWDHGVPGVPFWIEALRVLKPGGHLLAFGGTRTSHRLTCAIEDAGFEVRDCLMWLYGSGFPKSLDVSKAIDKAWGDGITDTAPATEAAQTWEGWGTALKPAWEPIIMARKPLIGTVAANVLEHGTGAINVDASRIGTSDDLNGGAYAKDGKERHDGTGSWRYKREGGAGEYEQPQGRWPANVLLDPEAAAMLDEQSGETPSRFFYTAKTSGSERHGNDGANGQAIKNDHPTVKPADLMAYLIRLVTPPGGTVLDPFMGSGSTGIAALRLGFEFVGIEREESYLKIAEARIREDAPLFNRVETVLDGISGATTKHPGDPSNAPADLKYLPSKESP